MGSFILTLTCKMKRSLIFEVLIVSLLLIPFSGCNVIMGHIGMLDCFCPPGKTFVRFGACREGRTCCCDNGRQIHYNSMVQGRCMRNSRRNTPRCGLLRRMRSMKDTLSG